MPLSSTDKHDDDAEDWSCAYFWWLVLRSSSSVSADTLPLTQFNSQPGWPTLPKARALARTGHGDPCSALLERTNRPQRLQRTRSAIDAKLGSGFSWTSVVRRGNPRFARIRS